MSNAERRCKQCGKIIVGDPKISLCPKCRDKDLRTGAVAGAASLGAAGLIYKFRKPIANLAKNIVKAIIKH